MQTHTSPPLPQHWIYRWSKCECCFYKYKVYPDERSERESGRAGAREWESERERQRERSVRRVRSTKRKTREQNTFTNYKRCIIPVLFFVFVVSLLPFCGCSLRLCRSTPMFFFIIIITYFISLRIFWNFILAPVSNRSARFFFFFFFLFLRCFSSSFGCGSLHFCLLFMPLIRLRIFGYGWFLDLHKKTKKKYCSCDFVQEAIEADNP